MSHPSTSDWCNPPPPGTDDDLSGERTIDRIDPYVKNPEYVRYERRRRSRSRSRSRRHKHRRRRYSSSRSRSRSRSRRHKRRRSRSRSASGRRTRKRRHQRSRSPRPARAEPAREERPEAAEEEEEEEEEDERNENAFKNDGTFMEMFKKMQEEQDLKKREEQARLEEARPAPPVLGKRRGGKVLKTGLVEKTKAEEEEDEENAQDAWTLYMKEVKRYKEACCDDDSKTRLLVK